MEKELAELESILSEHFGQTPLNTPHASQASDVSSDEEDDCEESVIVNVDDVIGGRVREYVDDQTSDFDQSEEEYEDAAETSDQDTKAIRNFLKDGCGCRLECNAPLNHAQLFDNIMSVREMTREERELYVMGTLDDCDPESTKRGKKRQRVRHVFRFKGRVVCKRTFMLAYDIGRVALANILRHMADHGIFPRQHGNKGKTKHNALKFEDIQRVVKYITNHADINGITQPAAPRGRDNIPLVYLSAETTKCQLHSDYVAASADSDPPVRTVKLSSFKTIWLTCLPHIKIASPRDDVCATCEKLRKKLTDAVEEEEKLVASTEMRDHVLKAQTERDIYNGCIRRSIETRNLPADERYTHYTFDFSQCVSLPHFSRQMGPLYFLSLRKIQLFGFRVDGDSVQENFLVDEGETMGGAGGDTHGPNSVISMLDWALEQRNQEGSSFAIHADNCPGQNKNKYVLGYLAWRVMTGQNTSLEYLMQIPGHARCLIDGGFAHIKKLYRKSDCVTLSELEALVNRSSRTNHAARYPQWKWRDWKTFLSQYFRSLNGIRKYQYFRLSAEDPGVITVKESGEAPEIKVCILKDPRFRFENATRPEPVPYQGLSVERHNYLYKSVRPYIRPTLQNQFCIRPEET